MTGTVDRREFLIGALAAGVVLGAKVPIVLAARGESMEVRMASCVLASLMAQRKAPEPRPVQPGRTPLADSGVPVTA